ncbi:MAG: hypothetical protein DI623_05660 [Sphingomonas sanxanigenens]|uniref:Uncharacterized protein n=1 Tax=Sphingomonas sanxanigenens TaxID=397260 RepID=A0A2W5AEM9_9SPHN|nr:MAG: hypothetical protein DI623_05660 [Sphingomonas sanxanigenens]
MSVTSNFYLARAAECARDAEQATLNNVRERCLRAEAAWRSMAARLLSSEMERSKQAAVKAAR